MDKNRKDSVKPPYDYLIVGAGLFGAVFAHEAHKAGKRCLVIDRRNHSGGNIYCEDCQGIHVHRYGAHIFHTDYRKVWEYVNQLVEFNRYTNTPMAFYKGKLYNLPFNMNTFYQLWGVKTPAEAREKIEEQRACYAHIKEPANLEEQALVLAGNDIYQTLIKGYTEKQWGRKASQLPAFIIRRLPFRFTFDNNYFNDAYQGIPVGGYNPLVQALLKGVEVRLGVDYFAERSFWDQQAEKILFTGCIDEFFAFRFGRLDYRSLRFEHKELPIDNYQGNAVINYTDANVPYTRIIEHKHFEYGTQPHTVITFEYPDTYQQGKEPYYPINDASNSAKLAQYQALAAQQSRVLFGGRLGQYVYADMDDTIYSALQLAEVEFSTNGCCRL